MKSLFRKIKFKNKKPATDAIKGGMIDYSITGF